MAIAIERLIERPECLPLLADWLLAEWPESVGHARSEALINMAGRTNLHRLPLGLVALDDGWPVGMATLALDRAPPELEFKTAYLPCLTTLYVDPPARRRGIGTLLCDAIAGEAARLGRSEIFLYTLDAAEFYRARNWQQLTDATPVFMRRSLATS